MMSSSINLKNATAKYRAVQVQTSSPVQLVVMLYDGIIKFAAEAEAAIEVNDRARLGDRVGRCLAILEMLTGTLDHSHAPELAENLLALYLFCKRRLFEANIKRDRSALADVRVAILPLREGFAAISK